jgi:hypothetical protein
LAIGLCIADAFVDLNPEKSRNAKLAQARAPAVHNYFSKKNSERPPKKWVAFFMRGEL